MHAGPGETVDVPVAIDFRVLRHREPGGWAVEPGDVVLSVGRSAGQLEASATVALQRSQ